MGRVGCHGGYPSFDSKLLSLIMEGGLERRVVRVGNFQMATTIGCELDMFCCFNVIDEQNNERAR